MPRGQLSEGKSPRRSRGFSSLKHLPSRLLPSIRKKDDAPTRNGPGSQEALTTSAALDSPARRDGHSGSTVSGTSGSSRGASKLSLLMPPRLRSRNQCSMQSPQSKVSNPFSAGSSLKSPIAEKESELGAYEKADNDKPKTTIAGNFSDHAISLPSYPFSHGQAAFRPILPTIGDDGAPGSSPVVSPHSSAPNGAQRPEITSHGDGSSRIAKSLGKLAPSAARPSRTNPKPVGDTTSREQDAEPAPLGKSGRSKPLTAPGIPRLHGNRRVSQIPTIPKSASIASVSSYRAENARIHTGTRSEVGGRRANPASQPGSRIGQARVMDPDKKASAWGSGSLGSRLPLSTSTGNISSGPIRRKAVPAASARLSSPAVPKASLTTAEVDKRQTFQQTVQRLQATGVPGWASGARIPRASPRMPFEEITVESAAASQPAVQTGREEEQQTHGTQALGKPHQIPSAEVKSELADALETPQQVMGKQNPETCLKTPPKRHRPRPIYEEPGPKSAFATTLADAIEKAESLKRIDDARRPTAKDWPLQSPNPPRQNFMSMEAVREEPAPPDTPTPAGRTHPTPRRAHNRERGRYSRHQASRNDSPFVSPASIGLDKGTPWRRPSPRAASTPKSETGTADWAASPGSPTIVDASRLVWEAPPRAYWAGRFQAISDRLRTAAVAEAVAVYGDRGFELDHHRSHYPADHPASHGALDAARRAEAAMAELRRCCRSEAALESLRAFSRDLCEIASREERERDARESAQADARRQAAAALQEKWWEGPVRRSGLINKVRHFSGTSRLPKIATRS